ncbi:MAG: radical SAM protein [Clostridia bacterium]|nr:radical SAM protein [Clostridia bacterium]
MKEKYNKRLYWNNDSLLFIPESMKLFKIEPQTKEILESIGNGCEIARIKDTYNLSEQEFEQYKSLLKEKCPVHDTPTDTLIKLTIIISSKCNLTCKYCYANSGRYDSCNEDIKLGTIKATIDTFYKKYSNIQNIMLFGGEPTLNMDAIEYCCSYIDENYKKGIIKSKPTIGLVTNGTTVNDRFIEIINKYGLQITVSLDGPQEINDINRLYLDGSGTFADIKKNIKLLQEKTSQPYAIEATYTSSHVEKGYSVVDIVQYIKETFGVSKVHIAPTSEIGSKELCIDKNTSFIKAIDDVYQYQDNDKDYSYTSLNVVLDGLKNKVTKTHFCEAGLARYAVSTKGEIYPCYLFTDNKATCMGNVDDENVFESHQFKAIEGSLRDFNRHTLEKCKDCFNNTLCRQCIAENYFSTGDLQNVPDKTCEFSKERAKHIMINMGNRT